GMTKRGGNDGGGEAGIWKGENDDGGKAGILPHRRHSRGVLSGNPTAFADIPAVFRAEILHHRS
ncbi:MAG: hypothetical protein ABFD12_11505, partial [Syntrophorhabdus sp.]